MGNRIVYNSVTDSWGKWAWTDGSDAGTGGFGSWIGSMPSQGHRDFEAETLAGAGFGGTQAILSRGAKGFVGLAFGPDPLFTTVPFDKGYAAAKADAEANSELFAPFDRLSVGIASTPPTVADCARGPLTPEQHAAGKVDCSVRYIPSAYLLGNVQRDDNRIVAGLRRERYRIGGNKLGKPAMQHIGPGGDSGDRFLLGYATGLSYPNIPELFYLAEIDADGRVYGAPTELNQTTAWGEEDVWVQLPKSGCVAWPYAWKEGAAPDTAGYGYSAKGGPIGSTIGLSNKIRITTVCPSKPGPGSTQPCTGNCQRECPAGSAGPDCQYTDEGTCGGRGIAMDNILSSSKRTRT